MSIEFTPPTNSNDSSETAKGIHERIADLRVECVGATLHDPYDTDKLRRLGQKASMLRDIATELGDETSAYACKVYISRLKDTLAEALQGRKPTGSSSAAEEGYINHLIDTGDPDGELEYFLD